MKYASADGFNETKKDRQIEMEFGILHFYEFGHFGPTDEDKIIQNMSERQLFILENI